jgi:hypothetical protein
MRKAHTRVMRNLFLLTILVLANYVSVGVMADEKPAGMLEPQIISFSKVQLAFHEN